MKSAPQAKAKCLLSEESSPGVSPGDLGSSKGSLVLPQRAWVGRAGGPRILP